MNAAIVKVCSAMTAPVPVSFLVIRVPRHQLTYKDAANMTSRLMAACAASICWNSVVLPITLAASLTSLQANSSVVIVLLRAQADRPFATCGQHARQYPLFNP